MGWFLQRWISCFLILLVFFRSFTIANAYFNNDNVEAFYSSSRIFQEAPTEGITLLSTERVTNSFLLNGTTDDIVFQFVFKPPPDISPSQYTTSFECNSGTVSGSQSCSKNDAEADIVGTTSKALNTTVRCAFSRFPGSTECKLVATLQDSARQIVDRRLDIQSASRQTARYESEVITNNIYGVVFYIPDSNGQLSEDAQIVSGESNAYRLSNYDRTEQDAREVSTYAFIPGVQATGSSGLEIYSAATTNINFGDFIFRYDSSCQLTGALFENGRVSLPQPDACGVGMTVQDETSYPTLGVKFRAYKSGKVTIRLFWTLFGTSDESYEQIITFEIQESAPPVIRAVEKLDFYKSVPCEVEILKVIAYNVRFADRRQVVVFSLDGQSSSIWSEAVGGIRYNEDADMSELTFESGGGTGQGVSFGMQAIFGDEVRTAVTLTLVDLTLVFTTPVLLTGLNQTVVQAEGGEILEVSGALEEFGSEDSVYIGSFQIPAGDLISYDNENIVLLSPPLSDLGSSFAYPITVGVCAERSNALTLQYQVAPILKISSSDSSIDESGAFVIKASEETSFVAEVTGNNIGVTYVWKLYNPAGEEINTGAAVTNSQVFLVSPSFLESTNLLYTIRATVKNSLDLSVTEEVTIMRAEVQEEYVLINVHEVSTLQRSVDIPTLVQAHVATETTLDPTITLQWTYRGNVYPVNQEVFQSENGAITSQVTGPTRFGLEFFIMREDMVIGSQDVSLSASLVANPDIKGSDKITIVVVASSLRAVINDGINGTLSLAGTDLELSGSGSGDPDVLPGEGDDSEGLTYEWINCRKSLLSSFTSGVSDCSTLFPAVTSSENITIPSDELLSSRLETGSSPPSTYLSFGLRVSKGVRKAETFLYVELRTVSEPQKIPKLTSLEITDRKGSILTRKDLSKFGDIIIQPASDDELVSWSFDMSLRNQRYLFTQFGALKNSTVFMSNRDVKSRLPMGFNAGVLDANTKYLVEVMVSANDTDITSSYEIAFQTAEVPSLTCTPPENGTGVIADTKFTVSATLSFETQGMEYCFFLTTDTEQFVIGDGCSTVPFATFSFYRPGIYAVTCIAKTSDGHMVDTVTITDAVTLSAPSDTEDEITKLSEQLSLLEAEVDICEAQHDDACLISLISVAKDLAIEIETATSNNDSTEAQDLRERTKAYVARLAQLSNSLAENTVFRPNQVSTAVDLSYNLLLIPAAFIESEQILYFTLRQAESAINATANLVPIDSEELVNRVSSIGNRSITTAYGIGDGTSRSLRSGRAALVNVLFVVPGLLAKARAQQAECGVVEMESTASEDGDTVLPAVEIGLRVVCQGGGAVTVADVRAGVCDGAGDSDRVVVSAARIPGALVMVVATVDMVVELGALVEVDSDAGVLVGEGCLNVVMSSRYSDVTTARLVRQEGCESCLELKNGDDMVVIRDGVVDVRTSQGGLFVIGRSLGDITGHGAVWVVGMAVVIALAGILAVLLWLGTGVAAQEEDGGAGVFDWEYIERDLWGRETPGKTRDPAAGML